VSFKRGVVIIRANRPDAESITRVKLEKFVNDIDGIRLKLVRDYQLTLINLVEDLIVDLTSKGSMANSHLVDHAAESPEVHARR